MIKYFGTLFTQDFDKRKHGRKPDFKWHTYT